MFVSFFPYLWPRIEFEFQVGILGRSFYLAGVLGSQNLPVPILKGGKAGKPFTIIQNDASIKLAERNSFLSPDVVSKNS